jgi:hypothetical protein
MNDLELARLAERTEMRAWNDAVRAATPELVQTLGLAAAPVADGMGLVASRVRSLLYNRAFGFGLDAPIDETALDRAIALYRRDAPFTIQPSPTARPREIGRWLNARGLESHFDWVIWVREAAPVSHVATPLGIDRIGLDDAADFARLACGIFTDEAPLVPWITLSIGRPGWNHYVARDGDEPVAIAALHVAEGAGWLGWGGTLKSHRGRGAQSALIARRVRDATSLGARWLTVETAADLPQKPNPSYRNVQRAGFRLLHLRPSYAHVPDEGGAPSRGR